MENMYAVVDTTTRAILVFPRSYTTAVYVSQGITNSEAILIPSSLQSVSEDLKQYNLDTDVLKVAPKNGSWVELMPDMLITKSLMERRTTAKLRAKYIYIIEQQFKVQNVRSLLHYDESVNAHLLNALNQSDPSTNTYSYGILEYANIQKIDPSTAYEELTVMLDSSGLIKIRNFAWFMEYVRRFNMHNTKKSLDEEIQNAWDSIARNSQI